MFGMHANMPLVQQFAGYALVVPFLLQIVTGLLPDFRIIAWLLQFYIVYVVWEGAPYNDEGRRKTTVEIHPFIVRFVNTMSDGDSICV